MRALTVETSALGQLEPSLVRNMGSVPALASNFACTSAGVIVHAELEMWHELHVRPFVPRFWKNGFVMSIPPFVPYVLSTPVASIDFSGFGRSFPPNKEIDPNNTRARERPAISTGHLENMRHLLGFAQHIL